MSHLERRALLLIRAARLPAPQRYQFAKADGRRWEFDFAWPEHRVALEIDGGAVLHRRVGGRVVMVPGRHHSEAGRRNDMVRDAYAALHGWLVLRADKALLDGGQAVAWVAHALALRSGGEAPKALEAARGAMRGQEFPLPRELQGPRGSLTRQRASSTVSARKGAKKCRE